MRSSQKDCLQKRRAVLAGHSEFLPVKLFRSFLKYCHGGLDLCSRMIRVSRGSPTCAPFSDNMWTVWSRSLYCNFVSLPWSPNTSQRHLGLSPLIDAWDREYEVFNSDPGKQILQSWQPLFNSYKEPQKEASLWQRDLPSASTGWQDEASLAVPIFLLVPKSLIVPRISFL